MSILSDYIRLYEANNINLEDELTSLIKKYNAKRNTYLYVYATAFQKGIPDAQIIMDDFYIIHGMLKNVKSSSLDFYIESPGGYAEAAEEIAECLHSKFLSVSFVISGEAKSAGTILALSGDEILMSETGSLGPVDAQMRIARGNISAFDYIKWMNDLKKEANDNKKLNPVDAIIVAQINPGEYQGVDQALQFAQDLIKKWLPKYKFKNWTTHESTGLSVTPEDKIKRAGEIAEFLVNHTLWRSHGRSLKIPDLEGKLIINEIDKDPELADIVYRIQAIIKLNFITSTSYKIFMTADDKIFQKAIPNNMMPQILPSFQKVDVMNFDVKCQKCGKDYKFYGKFTNNSKIDNDMAKQGILNISKNVKFKCSCGFEHDLKGICNDIEQKTGRKLVS